MGAFLQVVIGGVARTQSSRRFTGRRVRSPRLGGHAKCNAHASAEICDSRAQARVTRARMRDSAPGVPSFGRRSDTAVTHTERCVEGTGLLRRCMRDSKLPFSSGIGPGSPANRVRRLRDGRPHATGVAREPRLRSTSAPFAWISMRPLRPASCPSSVTVSRGGVARLVQPTAAGSWVGAGAAHIDTNNAHRIRGSHTNDDGSLLRGLQWQTL
jgi:hypothetical protein